MKSISNIISKNSFSARNVLYNSQKKNYTNKELHVYMGGGGHLSSGIKICFFGGNSATSTNYARWVLRKGTPVNMVHRCAWDTEIPFSNKQLFKDSNPYRRNLNIYGAYDNTDEMLKWIRPFGQIGSKTFSHAPDLTNEYEVENAIRHCDVVINTIGANDVLRKDEDFEEANIIIARNIAKACANQKGNPVKRLIHFSANGTGPDAVSRDLKTKWVGELEVKEHFPDATIIRPTEILNYKLTKSFVG